MFGTIRKHQTWLWAVIIAVIIVSFVFFFSPYAKMNDTRRGPANYGTIGGEPVTEAQFAHAWREAQLRYFFMNGNWPNEDAKKSGFDPEKETFQWLMLLQKANQMGVHVSSDQVALAARNMLSQFQRSGITSPEMFIKQVLEPRGFQVDDLERFVRHYLTVQELIGTLGSSGKLVTPQEARVLYERENQDAVTEAVFFSASNYLAGVTVTPEGINQFYTNRQAVYRLPDRVQLSYVLFNVTNFMAGAEAELMKTNFNEIVDATLQRIGTNYLRIANTPAEAKVKIREQMIRERAMVEARRKAAEFATKVFDMEPVSIDNLDKIAAEQQLAVSVTPPFSRDTPPKDMEVGSDFASKAFTRTAQDPFAGPILGQAGAYVFALKNKIPSEMPSLDQIREKVTEDYKQAQALSQARQAGIGFYPVVTNGLAQGKSFASICLGAQFKPVSLPPFSLSTRELPEAEDHIDLNQLKQIVWTTTPGQASQFQLTRDGGVIVYVKTKLAVDEVKMNAALPAFLGRVRQNRENEAFNQWFSREWEKLLRENPNARPAQPPPNLTPGAAKAKKA